MMKKLSAALIALLVLSAGCGKESPSVNETKAFYKDMITLTDEAAVRLRDVKDSKDAAAIVSEYVDAQKVLIRKGKALKEKYPDLSLHDDPALKEYERSLEEATKRLTVSVTGAMKKYSAVKEFAAALKRFDEIASEAEKE